MTTSDSGLRTQHSKGCPSPSRLQQLLVEPPAAEEQAALGPHLDECPTCRQRLDELAGADPALLDAARALQGRSYTEGPSLRRVLDRVSGDSRLRTLYHSPERGEWQPAPPRPPVALDLLGAPEGYEINEVLGHGGMGQVFRAYEPALKRWVAIKALAPHLAGEEVARLRFAREARAAAAVRHENVITIHAVREANGLPYFVMEYVAGGSLQEHLDRGRLPDWRTVARLGAEIAAGLAAAHARGLIHRDIKPSNILLATDGADEPGTAKISDFGLARVADESRLTQTGLIAGTPLYMAPEQVRGEPLDHRADLFSLGSVLYTLCTGREPFAGDGPMAVIRQVCDVTPPPVAEVNPAIPPWLSAVVQRLHAKAPDDRFATAAEVADLLRYNLEHPDRPRDVPRAAGEPHTRRTKRRRRLLALAGGLLMLSVLLLILGALMHPRSPWRRFGPADSDGATPRALGERAVLRGHSGPVWSVAFSTDGRTLASGSDDTTLRLWDIADGREKGVLSGHNSAVLAVAFAHSGLFVLSSSADGSIRLWDVATRRERTPLTPHTSNARRIALSPDDRTAAMANNRQGVDLWDLEARQLRRSLPGDQGTIQAVAFAPDGHTLAIGDARGRVRLWDPETGQERAAFPGDPLGVRALAYAPDGRTLASAGTGERDVKLWDVADRRRLRTLSGLVSAPLCLAFSPDGAIVAAGTRDGAVLLWDVAGGRTLAVQQAHQGVVWGLAFSPDGRTLATGGEDRLVKLWDASELIAPPR